MTIEQLKKLKCPEAYKGCKPHGWPRGNPKYKKQQATSHKEQGSSG